METQVISHPSIDERRAAGKQTRKRTPPSSHAGWRPPWGLIGTGAATVVEAKLSSWESYLALFGFCVLASASYLAMEIYAGFKPHESEALLARFRTWMETRTDQMIIFGSLILGFWLIANSIYLIVT